jgi:NTP pyrophosphatase (non-canonical NTP hydrolase)
LQGDFLQLKASGCEILSPRDVQFVAEVDGFVLAEHELDMPPDAIELRHLEYLRQADFVWLHAPEGYVGASAAMELGIASELGLPVYARTAPADPILARLTCRADSPQAATDLARSRGAHTPAPPLRVLQDYYRRMADARGYADESARDTLLLLVEEVGELARAIRKSAGLPRPAGYEGVDAAHELADVQLYVLHLANALDVDLAQAVIEKEQVNAARVVAARAA